MSEPNDTHTTAWRFVRRRQARGLPPRRRAVARYRREYKAPGALGFFKNPPGFQKFFKSLLCQNSQISLNLRSASGVKWRLFSPYCGSCIPTVLGTCYDMATYPCIYVYDAPGIKPSSLW